MSNTFGIPTKDGYLCNLREHTIRKRTMADFFSKTFNVNVPGSNNSLVLGMNAGSNNSLVLSMNEFINNFACEREELSTFLKQT